MGLAGCQIRKARSWHVREGRRGIRRYLPRSYVTAYLLCTLGTPPPEKGGEGRQLEWDRTGQNGIGETTSLNWPLRLALAYPLCSPRYCCSTIARTVRRSRASAGCQSLCHINTHPERYMSILPELGGACRCAVQKKLPGRGPPCPQ